MGEVMASLHWQEKGSRGISMMPYGRLSDTERWLAETLATGCRAWLKKAMFPQYVAHYMVVQRCRETGLSVERRLKRRARGAMFAETRDALFRWHGREIGIATQIQPEGFDRPYWQIVLGDGRVIESGSLDCLAVELADLLRSLTRALLAAA